MGQQTTRKIQQQAVTDGLHNGKRFDQIAAELFSDFSRSRLTEWIKNGALTVDGKKQKPSSKLAGTETLMLNVEVEDKVDDQPEPMDLDIIHQDDSLLVINKPAGLVVHPAAGHPDGTLLNGLLYQDPALTAIPRAGIVHRIDRDTTGLMVVARTLEAQAALAGQLQSKTLYREYEALAVGVMTGGGKVDAPIGRHPRDRKRMAVIDTGKPAITHYRVKERFRGHTLARVQLETGRTHQIRVHLAHRHYPLVGDKTYGGRPKIPARANETLRQTVQTFQRQALHARKLGLIHPASGEYMEFEAPRPDDMAKLITVLRNDTEQA